MDDDVLGLCWSCQIALDDKTAVWIDNHYAIQCCKACWEKVPVAQRLEIAMKFHDRSVNGFGIQETLQMVRDALQGSGFFSRVVDQENRRN